MSDYIDTREGWRKLGQDEVAEGDWVQVYDRQANSYMTWVRESPVPPLPTAQNTVIAGTIADLNGTGLLILVGDLWVEPGDGKKWVPERITSFEVLAEPVKKDEQ